MVDSVCDGLDAFKSATLRPTHFPIQDLGRAVDRTSCHAIGVVSLDDITGCFVVVGGIPIAAGRPGYGDMQIAGDAAVKVSPFTC